MDGEGSGFSMLFWGMLVLGVAGVVGFVLVALGAAFGG